MKKFLSVIFVVETILLFSCSSTIRVPGESKIVMKNIAVEYANIADGYMDIKKYDKAIEYYKLSLKNKEVYLSSYYKLGRAYALGKHYDEAISIYSELLSADPENTSLKLSMAYIYAVSGKVDDAISSYKELMQNNPYDESILENFITLLLNIERAEDAEEYFYVMKEKFPDNSQISFFAQKISELIDNFDPDKKVNEASQKTTSEENKEPVEK